MILRIRDIPELMDLTEQHRQQVISQVERTVSWNVRSLLLCLTLALGFVGMCPVLDRVDTLFGSHGWACGVLTALTAIALCSLYRLVEINSFYRPVIQSLAAAGLPEEQERHIALRSLRCQLFSGCVC